MSDDGTNANGFMDVFDGWGDLNENGYLNGNGDVFLVERRDPPVNGNTASGDLYRSGESAGTVREENGGTVMESGGRVSASAGAKYEDKKEQVAENTQRLQTKLLETFSGLTAADATGILRDIKIKRSGLRGLFFYFS